MLAELATQLERVIQEELAGLLVIWLKQEVGAGLQARVPLETTARVVSWAILGTAIQWSQEPATLSSDQTARDILSVIIDVCKTQLGSPV